MLTLPSHLSDVSWGGPGWVEKIGWMTDACMSLQTFSADPSMASVIPSHHGLVQIHCLPRVQTLVPASDRFSSLRGLSNPLSTSSSGGVGENNLAFKCTRKRLLFETFHLDAEGGVSERRTTPTPHSFEVEPVPHRDSASVHQHDSAAGAALTIKLDEDERPSTQTGGTSDQPGGETKAQIPKKAKKKVGFQAARPDVYDF